jgi:glycosyltransferase involved in cell wall biosynthesis
MKISLIIPAHNEEKFIGICLEHAIRNSDGKFHEIIVVDNLSTDKTAEIAKKFPGVRVVREDRKGLTRARERGLREATGDFLAYIDADTRLPKNWLLTFEKILKKHSGKKDASGKKEKEVVCISGPYTYYDAPKHKKLVLNASWWVSAPLTYRAVGYMVLGGNFIARKSALLAMGGFDQSIEFYGEDTDIARRLSKHGKVIFTMDFKMPTSSRRFAAEGLVKTNLVYGMNYLWQVFFHKPFTKKYKDIRPSQ